MKRIAKPETAAITEDRAEPNAQNAIKFAKRSFISVVCILLGLIVTVGVLTFVIPAGQYQAGADGKVTDVFVFGAARNRLPVWRWFTAPFEVWGSKDGINLAFLSLLLLIMGGAFFVIDQTGGMRAMINALIRRFSKRKYILIWAVTFFFMLLAAIFGTFEDAIILLPIILILCKALKWDNMTALGMMLLAAAVGLSCSFVNPFAIGLASKLAGTSVLTGLWLRILVWLLMWGILSFFVTFFMAKKAEKRNRLPQNGDVCVDIPVEQTPAEDCELLCQNIRPHDIDKRKVLVWSLFFFGCFTMMLITYIPAIVDYNMPIMAVVFMTGSIVCGRVLTKDLKTTLKHFGKGVIAIAPAIVILMMSLSVKYIAERGEILHTIFYYFTNLIAGTGPYATILLIFVMVLVLN
ncbi:MAG: hypothetical protein FWE62_06175, partial [Firmicutes bacterium]|nr:hypothetical protein [Bacillota bacterium]